MLSFLKNATPPGHLVRLIHYIFHYIRLALGVPAKSDSNMAGVQTEFFTVGPRLPNFKIEQQGYGHYFIKAIGLAQNFGAMGKPGSLVVLFPASCISQQKRNCLHLPLIGDCNCRKKTYQVV